MSQADCVLSSLSPLDRAPSAPTRLLTARTAFFFLAKSYKNSNWTHLYLKCSGRDWIIGGKTKTITTAAELHALWWCSSQCLTTGALCLDAPCCQPPTSKAPPACKRTPALGGDPHSVFRPEGTLATGWRQCLVAFKGCCLLCGLFFVHLFVLIGFVLGFFSACILANPAMSVPCCLEQLLKLLTKHSVQEATRQENAIKAGCKLSHHAALPVKPPPTSHYITLAAGAGIHRHAGCFVAEKHTATSITALGPYCSWQALSLPFWPKKKKGKKAEYATTEVNRLKEKKYIHNYIRQKINRKKRKNGEGQREGKSQTWDFAIWGIRWKKISRQNQL